ncbi:UNVERIFIED_CONTAM: hypothetical protein Slati_4182100 [Sesamum latifolium]|uniref:Reverse transcriptase domain-containing protein n=1 Tax=Sesamum latifolium TaxID=2727402 RepID=A0AAW2TAB7_9LAMI
MGYAALKLDLSKAYDHVEWTFLERVLTRLGFHSNFISLVHMCVSTTSYSIVLSGHKFGFSHPERGLCQGDPLSLISSYYVQTLPVTLSPWWRLMEHFEVWQLVALVIELSLAEADGVGPGYCRTRLLIYLEKCIGDSRLDHNRIPMANGRWTHDRPLASQAHHFSGNYSS